VLALTVPVTGLRTYLAVRGGIEVAPVLGSRSYDVLAALGPPPVQKGDVLEVGPDPRRWPSVDAVPPRLAAPDRSAGQVGVTLTGSAGPHLNALAPGGPDQLDGTWWTVRPDSDRSGLRVGGPPLPRSDQEEWPVEGLVRGAIQLPPSGRPVVLLADHPVTGGYPAIGALDETSCDQAAQLRPGDGVRLRLRR
jgi:allophanate hydrolase subunit 2